MKRSWTTVGASLVADQEKTGRKLDRLTWVSVDGLEVGFSPGYAIKQAIQELRIPRVERIAIGTWRGGGGLYGIEGRYRDGVARVYLVDTGAGITPIASDFEPVAVTA